MPANHSHASKWKTELLRDDAVRSLAACGCTSTHSSCVQLRQCWKRWFVFFRDLLVMTDDGQTLNQRVVFVAKACNLQFQSHERSGMRDEESRFESLTIISAVDLKNCDSSALNAVFPDSKWQSSDCMPLKMKKGQLNLSPCLAFEWQKQDLTCNTGIVLECVKYRWADESDCVFSQETGSKYSTRQRCTEDKQVSCGFIDRIKTPVMF